MYASFISYFSIIYWAYLILFLWTFFWLLKYHLYLIVKGTKFRWALTRKEIWFSFYSWSLKSFPPKLLQFLLILCEIYIANRFWNFCYFLWFTTNDVENWNRKKTQINKSNKWRKGFQIWLESEGTFVLWIWNNLPAWT